MDHFIEALQRYTESTFSSLRVRNYRLYYIGQIISTSGTFMQAIAQDWLVLKLSNSGLALGVVTALQYLPILFFGPYGGLVADRFPKRRILCITQSVAGVLALVLGVLVATGTVQLWMVFVLGAALGINTIFDNPARQTFVVELVGEADLKNAVTLYSALFNLCRIIGPAIAAALIAAVGMTLCFFFNGISYVAVVIMLILMNPAELKVTPPPKRSKGQLVEGWSYAMSSPLLRTTLLMMTIIGTLTYEFSVTLPLMARFAFNGDASSYALLSASLGAGAVVGGLMIAGQRHVSGGSMVRNALFFGAAVMAAALMPNLWLGALALVAVGATSISFSSLANSLVQLESSPQMRGRMMGFWSIAVLGSATFGGPIVGWVGEALGPRWSLGLGAVAALTAAALGARLGTQSRAALQSMTGTGKPPETGKPAGAERGAPAGD
jgi:MFS family permease